MIHDSRTAGDDDRTANDVLSCLELYGPQTRATVAKRLGLSRTTLSTLMNRFIDQRLVREMDGGDPQGRGRPGIPVDLDEDSWFALGAEYSSARWVFVVANLKGKVVATEVLPDPGKTPKSCLSTLIKGINLMRDITPGRLLPAVGIGVPGLVDWTSGTIIRADDLGWSDVPVRDPVEAETGLRAFVLNRNRATGSAEARFGQGRNTGNFIYIGLGTGISAAIMLGGNLLHGHSYGAGEIGHLVVRPDGPLCRCGKRGCLQVMAGGNALAAKYAGGTVQTGHALSDGDPARSSEIVTGEGVCRLAMDGDEMAQSILRHAASHLGLAIGNLAVTVSPEKFILGGPLVRVGPILVDYIVQEARCFAGPQLAGIPIVPSQLDHHAGALGAACLVLNHKLELSQEVPAILSNPAPVSITEAG